MDIFRTLLLVIICTVCSSCSSLEVSPKPIKEYLLDNGHSVYQFNVSRADGTKGALFSNYNGQANERRPVILHITGSGCDSNLVEDVSGSTSGKSFGDFVKVAGDDYWVFTYEKRGVHPLDKKASNKDARACRAEFLHNDDIAIRARDNIELLRWLEKQSLVDKSKILLAGCSEGGFVAARMARNSQIPTHIGSFSGVTATQMFDFLIFTRGLWRAPTETDERNEKRIAELMNQYKDIMDNPHSLDKYYFGHPYKKWAIMFTAASHEDLLKTDRPIFMAHGSEDNASPIESADYVAVEFLRHGKDNLTYKRYSGLDHGFRSCQPMLFSMTKKGLKVTKNESCDPKKSNEFPKVIHDFLAWTDK